MNKLTIKYDYKLESGNNTCLYFVNKTDEEWEQIVNEHYHHSNFILIRKDSIEDMQDIVEARLELRKQGLL